ncbi:hypothetical protein KSX_70770 [Ktedonospora formicarum]|uniref:Uncharacterized protein n=1 Tax=Ktedonospora formicarum TaxID=2778364 RepID=A0A8J3I3Z6_9CHLR|nr:hypothetical protein KSX_70770 [Ktedonospora formicarum]
MKKIRTACFHPQYGIFGERLSMAASLKRVFFPKLSSAAIGDKAAYKRTKTASLPFYKNPSEKALLIDGRDASPFLERRRGGADPRTSGWWGT